MQKIKFTLMELLIVVAVIGILVSILLPSLKKAKDSALSAVCKSNLKQIGVGVNLYANSNKGYMPTSNIGDSRHFSPGLVFYTSHYLEIELNQADYLQTDLKGTVFDEPKMDGAIAGGITYPVAAGYGWNWRYMGYKQTLHGDNYTPKFISKILDASERMLAGDTSDTTDTWGHLYFRYQNVGSRHRNRINALHGDAAVHSIDSTIISTNNSSKWWFSDRAH